MLHLYPLEPNLACVVEYGMSEKTFELPSTYVDPELETITIEQMALILQKSPKTIRNLCYAQPDKLPPRIKLPGRSDFIWRKSTVLEWLKSCESKSGESAC